MRKMTLLIMSLFLTAGAMAQLRESSRTPRRCMNTRKTRNRRLAYGF